MSLGIAGWLAAACAPKHAAVPLFDPEVITADDIARSKQTNVGDVSRRWA